MKKLIASLMSLAVLVWTLGPLMATATITTGLVKDISGGQAPIVKAKWEANATYIDGQGNYILYPNVTDYYRDDSTSAGAQFNPSGKYQVNKKIALCAIVTDPDGLADIDNVYADVFYPEGIDLGSSHVALPEQSGLGCGKLMQEDVMKRLTKEQGLSLFCSSVRNSNENLPAFNTVLFSGMTRSEMYNEICKADGELQKETAAVYCATKDLSYEDPSGPYKVWAVAQDKTGQQGKLENFFTYIGLTAFEVDFVNVDYGSVRLNTHKIISGDLTWDAPSSNKPTVRNVGNTRLQMSVLQDDMNFGMTSGVWNVRYDARVGSDAAFKNYNPEALTYINNSLDLSELNEMDFSILVSKFPPTEESFYGSMELGARLDAHLPCAN